MQLDSSASPITIARQQFPQLPRASHMLINRIENIQTQSYVWTVTTGAFDIATSNVFYFRIQDHVYGGIFGSSFLNFTESGTAVSLGFPTPSTTSSSSTSTSSATTTTSSSTSTGVASETASPTTSQTATSSPASHSSSLSGGAIGGIAVGAVAIVAIVVLGWFFGYWRRRKNSSSPNQPELAGGEQVYQYQYPPEPKQQYVAYSKPPAEMGSNAPEARNNQTRSYEMGG
jgi:hypothetical protein